MKNCRPVTKEVLTNPIQIETGERDLSLDKAREIADQEARKHSSDPVLVSWYEAKSGRHSPPVECCGEEKPAWVVYAESRGANITIDINQEDYVFIYLDYSPENEP